MSDLATQELGYACSGVILSNLEKEANISMVLSIPLRSPPTATGRDRGTETVGET